MYKINLIVLLFIQLLSPLALGDMLVERLRCEYLNNPLGIDSPKPRLSWIVSSEERGQIQTAYEILVSSSEELLHKDQGDLWSTGKVESNETVAIVYNGKPLLSGTQYFWKLRAWDKNGIASEWSPVQKWQMGLLSPQDWKASWISYKDDSALHQDRQSLYLPAVRQYRKEVELKTKIKRATVYSTALGLYALTINGKEVTNQHLAPGWSDYEKRVYYNTYDVTHLLQNGANAFGAEVADGWYSGYVAYGLLSGYGTAKSGRYYYGKTPAFRFQLEIEYENGEKQQILTDSSWKVSGEGPTREADLLMGETYDARKELSNWNMPKYDDSSWLPAILASENASIATTFYDARGLRNITLGFVEPKEHQAYPAEAVMPIQEIKPIAITEPEKGVYIFNLGQNISGVARLNVLGESGQTITLRFGEMLHKDGRLMTENLRKARATDTYILKGDPKGESWQPKFTYHGFQYIEVRGLKQKPKLDTVKGIVLHSNTRLTSAFECSDPLMNKLFSNVVWTQRSNFVDIPTDCPQRDERLGWAGDAQIYAKAASYHADIAAFMTKWLSDLNEAQLASGAYPDYAPYPIQHGVRDSDHGSGWMDVGVIMPYVLYKNYGDTRFIETYYASMKKFMGFRASLSPFGQGVLTGNDWGDWLSIHKTPIEYVDAAYYAYTAQLMSEMATAIGKQEDATHYKTIFEKIKRFFAKNYLNDDGSLAIRSQTAYALAIHMKLIDGAQLEKTSQQFVNLIKANNGLMTTGFIGTRSLLPALTMAGQFNEAVKLFQKREFPSWGYPVVNGATSIWERWDSFTLEDGFDKHNAAMNSFSHYAFGAVSEWMFDSLAGIDTIGAGYKTIQLRPMLPDANLQTAKPINWVRAKHDSVRGEIVSDWKRDGKKLSYTVQIPTNTKAHVTFPIQKLEKILEDGKPLSDNKDIKVISAPQALITLEVPSGKYEFKADLD